MKTCKKILAMVLALAVVMSFASVTVNAYNTDTKEPTTSGLDTELWVLWDLDLSSQTDLSKTTYSGRGWFFDQKDFKAEGVPEMKSSTQYFGFGLSATPDVKDVEEQEQYYSAAKVEPFTAGSNNKVIQVNSDDVMGSYRKWFLGTDGNMVKVGHDVVHYSGKVMIPGIDNQHDDVKAVEGGITELSMSVSFPFTVAPYGAKPDGSGDYNKDIFKESTRRAYCTDFSITNDGEGNWVIEPITNNLATFVYKSNVSVPEGTWFELDTEIYFEEDKKLIFYWYVNNDEMIACAESNQVLDLLGDDGTKFGYGLGDISVDTTLTTNSNCRTRYYLDEFEVYTSNKTAPAIPDTLTITRDATTNGLTISGQIDASTYTKADLVIAFYNGNKLIAPITNIPVNKTGSDLVVSGNATVPAGATKVKAFVFDSLTTSKPLMKNATLNLGE